jgi:hypothetical protein
MASRATSSVYALHLEHYGTSFHLGNEKFWRTLTATHLETKWLAGYWDVWEDSNPNLTTTLDVAGHSLTSRLRFGEKSCRSLL